MYMSGISPHFTAGQMVYTVRQRCGRQLAIEAPTDADVVSTVPESATPAALGYAQQVWANQNPAQQPAGSPPGGGAMSSKALLCSLLRLAVRAAVHRGSVQEPLRGKDFHSAQHPPEAAGGRQEVRGLDGQLCRQTGGAD